MCSLCRALLGCGALLEQGVSQLFFEHRSEQAVYKRALSLYLCLVGNIGYGSGLPGLIYLLLFLDDIQQRQRQQLYGLLCTASAAIYIDMPRE